MPDPKKGADPAAKGGQAADQPDTAKLPFLMLLTLTAHGRISEVEGAADKLQAAEKMLEEIGGKVVAKWMTFGQYDAFIAGTAKGMDALTNFAAWMNEQGFFSAQTLLGVEPKKYTRGRH